MFKKLVVLGGGESGIGSAVLGVKQGYEVFLSDSGLLSQKVKEELNDLEVRFEEYGHDMNSILHRLHLICLNFKVCNKTSKHLVQ